MYTKEQYEEARAKLNDPAIVAEIGRERAERWQAHIDEYEAAHEAVVAAPDTAAPAASTVTPVHPELAPPEEAPPAPAPVGPPAPGPGLSAADEARLTQKPLVAPNENWTTPPAFAQSANIDPSLHNASKLKRFNTPTSYTSKSRSALGEIAANTARDPLDGPAANMYFEPTVEQFRIDMAPYLKAKGIQPGTHDELVSLQMYQDVQWEKAFREAEKQDRSIVRSDYIGSDDKPWTQLQSFLGDKADVASAFAKGYASGGSLGLTSALHTDADRRQLQRHPAANLIGELRGGMNRKSIPSNIAGFGTGVAGPVAGRLGRYALSAAIGGGGTVADIYGHAKSEELSDYLHGRKPDEEAKRLFGARLLGGALVGSGAGAAGEALAEGANWVRNYYRNPTSSFGVELRNAEAGGTATDLIHGLRPSSDVESALAKAHGGVPGSGKSVPMGVPVEYAANQVIGPVVNQHHVEKGALGELIDNETMQMLGSNPKLKQPLRIKNLTDYLYNEIIKRSRPRASPDEFAGDAEDLVAWNNRELKGVLKNSVKPHVELKINAPAAAARKDARAISIPQARAMGFDIEAPKIRQPAQLGGEPAGSPIETTMDVQDSEIMPGGRLDTLRDAQHVATPPLKLPPHYPEDAFVVLLEPMPLDAEAMQSAIKSIDYKANVASKQGSKDDVWAKLTAAIRQDRDKFGPEWGALKDRHHGLLTASEQRGTEAGITENQRYEDMAGSSRRTARDTITNYGVGEMPANETIAALADRAKVRPELETLRGTRAYTALKSQAEPALGVTGGGGILRVGGLLPGAKLRVDAAMRTVARGPQGEPLFVNGLNPEQQFLKSQPLGRSLLPSSSIFNLGRGAAGIRTGSVYDELSDREKPTGSLDPEQQRIIEKYLATP
jgi:hypothetical protein